MRTHFFAAIALLALPAVADAAPFVYTFGGVGSGTANGTTFDGAFTFTFYGDTANIDASASPFYYLRNVGGTFTEGSFTASIDPTVTLVATADSATPRINFFNAAFDNGLGINDPSLTGYGLASSIGPLTVSAPGSASSFLTPTFNTNGDGFATSGGVVRLVTNTSLTFTAQPFGAVPEPATWSMMVLGFGIIGAALRRRRTRNVRVSFAG